MFDPRSRSTLPLPAGPSRRWSLGALVALGALAALAFVALLPHGAPTAAARRAPAPEAPAPSAPARALQQPAAPCESAACVQISGRLATIDTTQSELLNALLGSLLDDPSFSLTALQWTELVSSDLQLDSLLDAAILELGVGSAQEALDASITLGELVDILAAAAQADGDLALVTLLDTVIAPQLDGIVGTISLGDLLQIDLPDGALATIEISALDLLAGSIELFNFENLATTPTPITITGVDLGLATIIDEVQLQAQVLEPPLIVCGGGGTSFHGAAIRLKLDLDLVDVGTIQSLNLLLGTLEIDATVGDLELYLEIGRAEGTIQTVDALTPLVRVEAIPGIVDLYLGHIDDAVFFNRTDPIDPATDLEHGTIGSVEIEFDPVVGPTINETLDIDVRAWARGEAPMATLLTFGGPFPETQTVTTSATFLLDLLSDLLANLDLDLDTSLLPGLLPEVLGALEALIEDATGDLLAPLLDDVGDTDLLTGLVDPLLEALGIQLGAADVTVLGTGAGDPCAVDLSVTKCALPDPATAGRPLAYTIRVANDGPDDATNVLVTDVLPAGVDFISAEPSQGSCSEAGGTVTCALGAIPVDGQGTVTIVVRPLGAGALQNSVTVTSDGAEATPLNNMAQTITPVGPAGPLGGPCLAGACAQISSRLASVDSTQSELLDALLGGLLGTDVNLSVAEWNAIAAADISLLDFLELAQAELGLATTEQVLEADLTLAEILDLAAQAAEADGDTAAVSALGELILALGPLAGTIQLGDLLQIDLPDGSLADVQLDLLDLVTGSIQLFNYDNVAVTPTPITISGGALGLDGIIDEVQLWAMVLEPPIFICDEAGAQFFSASLRLKLDLDLIDISLAPVVLPGLSLDVTVADVELYVVVGRATGTLQSIDLVTPEVIVEAEPGIVDLYLGQIPDSVFFDRTATIDPNTDLDFAVIGEVMFTVPLLGSGTIDVGARAYGTGAAPSATMLTFNGPFPETQTVTTSATFITDLLADLFANLEIDIDISTLPPFIQTAINLILNLVISTIEDLVEDLLIPVLEPLLEDLVDPLLEALGIALGEADVTVSGIAAACADLAVGKCPLPGRLCVDEPLSWAVTVVNTGPGSASDVVVADTLPLGVTFVSAVPSQGFCVHAAGVVTCALGDLAEGEAASVVITVQPNGIGILNNQATASSSIADPRMANNSASSQVQVVQCGYDLAITKDCVAESGDPEVVLAGERWFCSIEVTNLGPEIATGVVVTDTIGTGLLYSSDTDDCTLLAGAGPGGRDLLECRPAGTNPTYVLGVGQSVDFQVALVVPSSFEGDFAENYVVVAGEEDMLEPSPLFAFAPRAALRFAEALPAWMPGAGLLADVNLANNRAQDIDIVRQPPPTGVVLAGLSASAAGGAGVEVRWETASEVDLAGFLVYRRGPDGAWQPVGDLVPATGRAGDGAAYRLIDRAGPGDHAYRLEVHDLGGAIVHHGPVQARVFGLYLPQLRGSK